MYEKVKKNLLEIFIYLSTSVFTAKTIDVIDLFANEIIEA